MPAHIHFDCYSGLSGDMTLGALVDLGVDLAMLNDGLRGLPIGTFALRAEKVMRHGISGTQVHVDIEEEKHAHRHLDEIYKIIDRAELSARVKVRAKRAYFKLAEAEAYVHGTTVERIHFHEVGANDAILDIAGSMLGMELLGIDSVSTSTITTGFGMIQCAHGRMPVPAPATAQLLLGLPQTSGEIEGEMVTPTGAAILAALLEESSNFETRNLKQIQNTNVTETKSSQSHDHLHQHLQAHESAGQQFHEHPHEYKMQQTNSRVKPEELTVLRIGYGAGAKILAERPNFLRLMMCDSLTLQMKSIAAEQHEVLVLETEIDDMNPELAGYVMERLLALGALDVQFQHVQMKKNRPGLRLRVLAEPQAEAVLAECLFRETSTFGVRRQVLDRWCLRREMQTVETSYGAVRIKIGYWGETILKTAPEFEDCRKLAQQHGVPLETVYAAARAVAERNPA